MTDLPDLAPADAAVALRSLPRRFREALARSAGGSTPDDRAPDETTEPTSDAVETRAQQLGPDGTSPLEQVAATTAELTLFHQATTAVLSGSATPVHPAVVDRASRAWDLPPGMTVDDAMTLLEDEATGFASLVESADAREWAKSGAVAGGGTISAIALVSEAVRSAVERLRSIG